ncbi:hypothetical protein [Streptomyces sp. NPDC057694]|uniref:hypothetical protein n=1 Tax=Streptomyces sp. NPDC057694 TaxID=3346216 RepID=UPI00368E8D1E
MWEALERLFGGEELDMDLAERCSVVLEELLGSGRLPVVEMVSLRVTDYLLGYVNPWLRFKVVAGPLMMREVEERKPYYIGPF